MKKHELVGYLAGLVSVLDSFDDGGARLRPAWLTEEYTRAYREFKDLILKEKENARSSGQDEFSEPEAGADLPRG